MYYFVTGVFLTYKQLFDIVVFKAFDVSSYIIDILNYAVFLNFYICLDCTIFKKRNSFHYKNDTVGTATSSSSCSVILRKQH